MKRLSIIIVTVLALITQPAVSMEIYSPGSGGGGLTDGGVISGDTTLTSTNTGKAYRITADSVITMPGPSAGLNCKEIGFYKQGCSGVTLTLQSGEFQNGGGSLINNIDTDGWARILYTGVSTYITVYGTWTRTDLP